jgi:hypothetical protein
VFGHGRGLGAAENERKDNEERERVQRHDYRHLCDRDKLKVAFRLLRTRGISARMLNPEAPTDFSPAGDYVFTNNLRAFADDGNLTAPLYLSHGETSRLDYDVPERVIEVSQAVGLLAACEFDDGSAIEVRGRDRNNS